MAKLTLGAILKLTWTTDAGATLKPAPPAMPQVHMVTSCCSGPVQRDPQRLVQHRLQPVICVE